MRSRASLIAGAIALAICLLCPLIDMFDQWDHALQTGNDTEYPLVILALCVGAAFILGRLIMRVSLSLPVTSARCALLSPLISMPCSIAFIPSVAAPGSPPLSLRI